ncbi:MAG: hypothetical protein JNK75_14840 [Betaproteobacteria bacterium]|nr:hypothetical protein [Betaproteobacteria bacterium]
MRPRHFARWWSALLVAAQAGTALATSPPPPAPADPAMGERWRTATLFEYFGAQDRQPSRKERKSGEACLPVRQLAPVDSLTTDLPPGLKGKCWQKDKRAEEHRAQVKFACSDGSSVEAVVRRESPDVQGSQVVVNIVGQGAVSITRQMTRVPGATCKLDPRPAPPATTGAPKAP